METVGTYVGVRDRPTVVRLGDRDAAWVDDFLTTADVRRHVDALEAALDRAHGAGMFVIGPYGSGKSHLLAWLSRRLCARPTPPVVVAVSMLDHPASVRLEEVVCAAVGLDPAAPDRRPGWADALARAGTLVLLIDELSEFLKSKTDSRAFNEDVRFLQFLGEIGLGARLFVIAAMQEQIEHAGELDVVLYRKIRDRFPIRLHLGPTHTREVLAESVLIKRPGYDAAVRPLITRLREALPQVPLDEEWLAAVYPLHPETLVLLDEVRDRFSQTRGAVDFVVTQLRGDPVRRVPPLLDEPMGALLTADRIVDHFQDVIAVQSECLPLSDRLFPWWDAQGQALFDAPALHALAGRVLRLLAVVWLSPRREGLTADEATAWLLYAPARLDPAKNRAVVEKVLDKLATDGRYVRRDGARFHLDFADDGAAALEARVARELGRQSLDDEGLYRALLPLFESVLPDLPMDTWSAREVTWHNHPRVVRVWHGNDEPPPVEGPRLVLRLPWGNATPAPGVPTLVPARLRPGNDERTAEVLLRLRDEPQSPDAAARIARRLAEHAERICASVRTVMAQAVWSDADGRQSAPPPNGNLDAWSILTLERTFPSFAKYAPTSRPLAPQSWATFARAALGGKLVEPSSDAWLNVVRDGYLVPLGLLRRKGTAYESIGDADKHPLVRRIAPLLEHGAAPAAVYALLAEPVFGLVDDQVTALLLWLLLAGEVEITKGAQGYADAFETLPVPRSYDRVGSAAGLSGADRGKLEALVTALGLAAPRQWSVGAQRAAIEAVRVALDEVAQRLRPSVLDDEDLRLEVEAFVGRVDALGEGEALSAWSRFAGAIDAPELFAERARELSELPKRLAAQAAEVRRYVHLLQELGDHVDPPALARAEVVDAWLARSKDRYAQHERQYRADHVAFWAGVSGHDVFHWASPLVARSRGAGLAPVLNEIASARELAARSKCKGLVDLAYHPRCGCGFWEGTAGISAHLDAFEAARQRLQAALTAWMGEVAEPVRAWLLADPERAARARAWLKGEAGWPEIEDLPGFEACLVRAEPAPVVAVDDLVARLSERAYTADEVAEAVRDWARPWGDRRIRLGRPQKLESWCVARALESGECLPDGVTGAGLADLPVAPSERALARIEALGLAEPLVVAVARRVAAGEWAPCGSPLLEAAAEVARPSSPGTVDEAMQLAARLYAAHERLAPLGAAWLARLDAIGCPLPDEALVEVIAEPGASRWWVDGLGGPLAVGAAWDGVLPGFRLDRAGWARVDAPTTTEACWAALAARGLGPHAKSDGVDAALHGEPRLPFAELAARVARILPEAGRIAATKLDPGAPVWLFADHGFRLCADGARWEHGGPSPLERIVPVVRFVPRGQ
jgi:Family of unknown function (DUF6079)